jgi:hypothetical protein
LQVRWETKFQESQVAPWDFHSYHTQLNLTQRALAVLGVLVATASTATTQNTRHNDTPFIGE